MQCPDYTQYNQIIIVASFCIAIASTLVSFLILVGFCRQKSSKTKYFKSETTWYEYLAQFSIKGLISTDFIQGVVYLPLVISQFVATFFPRNRTVSILVIYENELTEVFVLSSGIWSFFVSLCITMSIYKIESEREVKLSWKLPSLLVSIACGLPLLNFIFWSLAKTKIKYSCHFIHNFSVFPSSLAEYIIGSLISNAWHSISYIGIELLTNVSRITFLILIHRIFSKQSVSFEQKLKIWLVLFLYTLPYSLTVVWIVLRRLVGDFDRIYQIIKYNTFFINPCMDIFDFTLYCVHKIMFPLRGFMDSVVYAVVNDTIFNCCQSRSQGRSLIIKSGSDIPAPIVTSFDDLIQI